MRYDCDSQKCDIALRTICLKTFGGRSSATYLDTAIRAIRPRTPDPSSFRNTYARHWVALNYAYLPAGSVSDSGRVL